MKGTVNVAWSAAYTMSKLGSIVTPMPIAGPLTAAIVVFLHAFSGS